VLRFCEFVEPTMMRPSLSVSLLTDTSAALAAPEGFFSRRFLGLSFSRLPPPSEE